MTTRDEARAAADLRSDVHAGASRALPADPALSLPERLYGARERKGVDLYRAERDTKIRARYLAALERGDYKELPGNVYTKGFLRNYALYLGLDPEDVIAQWKRERPDAGPTQPTLAVPRPLQAPRQGLTFTPGVVVAALLTLVVVGIIVYFGVQLMRFARPPTLAVTQPDSAVVNVAEDTNSYTLSGTSAPGATIRIVVPGRDQPYQVTTDSSGRWTRAVELRRGRNQFDITAIDPETGKEAEHAQTVYINVPFLVIEAPTLTVDSPADGAKFQNGAIPIKGMTTNAKTVSVAAQWLGPADGQPVPSPSGKVPGSPTPSPTVAPVSAAVGDDGRFETPLELSTGRWSVTVTATSAENKAVSLSRQVTIEYHGVNLVITVKGERAWLKVWVDGKVSDATGTAGRVYAPGKVLTFTADSSIEVRTGKSSVTYFTLNGSDLGHLSTKGNPETWLFAPPAAPQKTNRT